MELLTISGFNERYERHLVNCSTHKQAYEATEKEVIGEFKHRKYANFESFRRARIRWLQANFCKTR